MAISAARLRRRVYQQVGELLNQIPEPERYWVLVKHLLNQDPDAIPLKPDGRRMNSEEARRRVSARRDRA